MESVKKWLCCSRRKKKVTINKGYWFEKEKEKEERQIRKKIISASVSPKGLTKADANRGTPFVDIDSCSSSSHDEDLHEVFLVEAERQPDIVSVSTRARYTYGLEAFAKNAMIIFAETGERGRQVRERIDLLKSSFGDFRFEAETHVNKTKEEMEAILEEFFSQDFTAVGAVVVAALAPAGEAGLLAARAQRYHESLILRWLTSDQPPALRGKPKIYITEANRTGETADTGVYTLLLNKYTDVDIVGVHIPVLIDEEYHPLKMICEQLSSEASFTDIVYTATQLAEVTCPELKDRPIQIINTLQKDLRLEKAE